MTCIENDGQIFLRLIFRVGCEGEGEGRGSGEGGGGGGGIRDIDPSVRWTPVVCGIFLPICEFCKKNVL